MVMRLPIRFLPFIVAALIAVAASSWIGLTIRSRTLSQAPSITLRVSGVRLDAQRAHRAG